jgi:two-component system cell cycle sensor histidine kinase/response regulator CckA
VAGTDAEVVVTILRAVFHDAQDGIGLARGERLVVASPSLVALLGCADEREVLGTRFVDWVAPGERPRFEATMQRRPGEEVAASAQTTTIQRADGAEVLVGLRSAPFWWNGERWFVAALRRTDPRSAEALYRAVFDANTAVKLLVDPATGAIVDANEAAEAFYGWPLATLRTRTVADLGTVAGDAPSPLPEGRDPSRRWFRFRHRTASGDVRHVEVHRGGVEVLDRSLDLWIVQDVTEQVQLEERLQEARRLESIGLVAAGVAHDFANLHTILLGCADSLARELPPDSPGRGHLQDVLHAARRAGELARRLVDAGQPHPRPGPAPRDLGRAIEALIPFLRRAAGSEVAVEADLPEGFPVSIEDDQLERVLVNLVLNARDAGARQVLVEVSGAPSAVVLRVRDDGAGMAASVRARAFEPFFTTRSERRGRGLGLSAVRGIVTHGGGTIEIAPPDGSGTTLEIRWPRPAGSPRVLLVEDEPDVREVLQQAVTAQGFEVVACAGPAEASALSDDALRGFGALVTDQRMPGGSGVELATALTARHPGLGVVLISGDLSPAVRASLPPAWRFLRKPFTGRDLAEILRNH